MTAPNPLVPVNKPITNFITGLRTLNTDLICRKACINLPKIKSIGPREAANRPNFTTNSFVCGSKVSSQLNKFSKTPTNFSKYGISISPTCIATSFKRFFNIASLLAIVAYLCSASFARALFSSHAVVPISKDWLSKSPAPAALSKVSLSLISVIPKLSTTARVDLPSLSVSFKPEINATIAPAASSLNALANCSEVISATVAKSSRVAPPFSTAD